MQGVLYYKGLGLRVSYYKYSTRAPKPYSNYIRSTAAFVLDSDTPGSCDNGKKELLVLILVVLYVVIIVTIVTVVLGRGVRVAEELHESSVASGRMANTSPSATTRTSAMPGFSVAKASFRASIHDPGSPHPENTIPPKPLQFLAGTS